MKDVPFFSSKTLLMILTGVCSLLPAEAAPNVYSGALYQATVSNNRDSGLVKVMLGGKKIISGNHVCDIVRLEEDSKPKNGYSSEEDSPLCTFKDRVFTSSKDLLGLRPQEFAEKAYATVDKKITFSDNGIKVDAVVTDQQPIRVIDRRDAITLVTKSLAGMRVEGTLLGSDEVKMALIPHKYTRKNWRYNFSLRQLRFVGQDVAITVKAGEKCKIILSHWGGSVMSLGIYRIFNRSEQLRKPGDKATISYTITFDREMY